MMSLATTRPGHHLGLALPNPMLWTNAATPYVWVWQMVLETTLGPSSTLGPGAT